MGSCRGRGSAQRNSTLVQCELDSGRGAIAREGEGHNISCHSRNADDLEDVLHVANKDSVSQGPALGLDTFLCLHLCHHSQLLILLASFDLSSTLPLAQLIAYANVFRRLVGE